MKVLLLTVFLSLLLAGIFLACFIRERRSKHLGTPEQDALRPFDLEKPKIVLRK
ncbi:hypothetical protein [Coraliomargarita parva]|uniref:hypothetical protein n=1 Tax=Coraliomargarita parva TaxID=3014050 RepID=UPI0022B3DEF6|nr:hypothetical protein [Coraliomargarita parva]